MTEIVQKLWGFCHTLRHDGIDYGDYIEQLTYLLFRYCLFAIEETDIRPLLRGGAPDAAIADAVRSSVACKWIGHEINSQRFAPPPRPMYSIGG